MQGSEENNRQSLSPHREENGEKQKVSSAQKRGCLANLSTYCLRARVKGRGQSELITSAKHNDERNDLKPGRDGHVSDTAGSTIIPDLEIFNVSFDGDQDPICPRSMPLIRKWIIVIIVCTGTLCV